MEAGEGVNLSFIFKRQSKEKILSKIAQTTMVNRSRMRDVGDTRQDFEELDSAISSGLYLKDVMNRHADKTPPQSSAPAQEDKDREEINPAEDLEYNIEDTSTDDASGFGQLGITVVRGDDDLDEDMDSPPR